MSTSAGATKSCTLEEWRAEGKARFGNFIVLWRFQCPICKNVATPMDFVKAGKGYHEAIRSAPQFCLGNFKPEMNCDWKAFGLIRGPVMVQHEDGETPAFEFGEIDQ